ncbi:MAG: ATP-grasp domain-containing protein, partial [Pseudomonadota bacterium]|nr:ATP-grasp domain-containing protein [Pseudomonadota bacterium]
PERLIVNPLGGDYIDHDSKAQFYEKLGTAGFRVPRSLTTNDPDAARAFLMEVGETVVKPTIGIGSTRILTENDHDRLDGLRTCPTLMQERIEGRTLRLHVVGDTLVLALRIESDMVDSRTEAKHFTPVTIAPEEAERLVAANRFLGLHYAAWDGIVDSQGRLVYLDCNPGPNLMWLCEDHRKAVFSCLATYLVTFSRSGSIETACNSVNPVSYRT